MTTTGQSTTSPPFGAGALFATTAAAVLPLAIFAPLGIAPLGAILALAIASLAVMGWIPRPKFAPAAVVIIAALVVWAAITVFWSAAPDYAATTAVRLAAIAAAGSLTVAAAADLGAAARAVVGRAMLVGIVSTIVVLLIIALVIHVGPVVAGDAPAISILGSDRAAGLLIGFNRTASVVALMVWPACIAAARRRPALGIALFAAVAIVLLLLNSSAPVLALGLASIVFAIAFVRARVAAVALAIAIVAVTAATPGLNTFVPAVSRATEAAQYVNGSFNHRLQIWSYVAGRAAERPFTGWGLEASRTLGNSATVDVTTSADGKQAQAELLPLHPHNALLQVWVELGLPGAALTALLLVWLAVRVGFQEADRLQRAAALAALTAALVVAELSYGLWQGWWQATLWLTAALTVAVARPVDRRVAAEPEQA